MASSNSRKTSAQSVICFKCKSKINIKETVLCAKCKKHYEYNCVGLSEKLFRLMDLKKKQNWKCPSCNKTNKVLASTSSPDNITFRRNKPQQEETQKNPDLINTSTPLPVISENNYEVLNNTSSLMESDLSESSFLTTERLSKSADHTVLNDTTTEHELRENIILLKTELISTQTELENTILENNELKRSVLKLTKDTQLLKSLCKTPRKEECYTQRKRHSQSSFDFFTPPRVSSMKENNTYVPEIATLQKKIFGLQQTLQEANHEIHTLKEQIKELQQTFTSDNKHYATTFKQHLLEPCLKPNCCVLHDNGDSLHKQEIRKSTQLYSCERKPRIYIFGGEQVIGIGQEIVKTRRGKWNDMYDVNSFIKPYATSTQILNSCFNLLDISKNDIIVLSVGINDKNPYKLITELCNVVSKFKENKIFVIGIYRNSNLNVSKLNYELELMLRNYCNCTFLNIDYHQILTISLLDLIIMKINIEIDYLQYENEFIKNLTHLRRRHKLTRQNSTVIRTKPKLLRKEKITDYFLRQKTNNCKSANKDIVVADTECKANININPLPKANNVKFFR